MKRLLLPSLVALTFTFGLAPLLSAAGGSVRIIKFEADWCGACQKMKPVYAAVSKTGPSGTSFETVNVDRQSGLADQYNVELLPTIIAVKNGKVVGRTTGYQSAMRLKAFVKKHQ